MLTPEDTVILQSGCLKQPPTYGESGTADKGKGRVSFAGGGEFLLASWISVLASESLDLEERERW